PIRRPIRRPPARRRKAAGSRLSVSAVRWCALAAVIAAGACRGPDPPARSAGTAAAATAGSASGGGEDDEHEPALAELRSFEDARRRATDFERQATADHS